MSWWQWYRLTPQQAGVEGIGWSYRRPITINNTSGGALSDYQVLVELTPANFTYSHVEADGADLRFRADDGITLLSYWVEEWVVDGTSKIWVEVDSIPTGNNLCAYIYYGKSDASDASNGNTTFLFFDDFLGDAIDTDKWEGDTGNASVANSIVTFPGPRLRGKTAVPKPFIMELKGYWENVVTGAGSFGTQQYPDAFPKQGFYVYVIRNNRNYCRSKGPTGAFTQTRFYDTITSWYRHVVKWKTGEVKHYINGNLRATHTGSSVPTADLGGLFFATYGPAIYCDWMFFRKYASVEPSYVVGAEEEL